jgi:hypothetical protein
MTSDVRQRATENVERLYGKRPSLEPIVAALYVAGGAFVLTSLFRVLSPNFDLEGNFSMIVMFIGAIAGALVQWRRREFYRRRISKEYTRLSEGRK